MILRLAFRYSFSSIGRHRERSFRLAFSVAVSIAAVIIVISIMEFLQEGRLDRIRAVRSFDTVIPGDHAEDIRSLYPGFPVFAYGETDALLSGHAVKLRFIDEDYDGGLIMLAGNQEGLVVSYPVMLSLPESHSASLLLLSKGRSGRMLPSSEEVSISGIYTTEMGRAFDELYAFLPIEMMPEGIDVYTALKGKDISSAIEGMDAISWKESESALYSAFMLEKMMMYTVLFLLFIIIAVSMKQTIRIFYRERRSEIAELLILGMERSRVRLSFLLSFMIVLAIGIALGYLLSIILLPPAGRYLDSIFHRGAGLSVPYDGFMILSLFLLIAALLFSAAESRKAESTALEEVRGE